MKPIEFEGCNVKFAEHQEEYETLPAKVTPKPKPKPKPKK